MSAALVAVVREVSRTIDRCELTHLGRVGIDLARAREQHRLYTRQLLELGCEIVALPEAPELPDAVFVEDTAVVLDEVAIVARPARASRRPEIEAVARALAPFRRLVAIEAPATLEGGDVLRVGRRLFVGRSSRTNSAGAAALAEIATPLGYRVVEVGVERCLHLKSAATEIADGVLLVNPRWVDVRAFAGLARIEIDPAEPLAANALRVGAPLLVSDAFPRTRAILEEGGSVLLALDLSEIQKAEGAVTCCSLVFPRVSAQIG